MFGPSVMSPENKSANFFLKSNFVEKRFLIILNLYFKTFSTFNEFLSYVFLQYFSLTSYCVNEVSESEDLLIRGGENLYFNELLDI